MSRFAESLLDFIAVAPSIAMTDVMKKVAITGFTDAVGVMLAGRNEPVVRALLSYIDSHSGAGEAGVMLGATRAPASAAALVGATAAHALDYDDYAYSNHPSAVMVPAILAEAQAIGASGAQMLRAYIAGYEVWAAVMKREPDHLHSKGWHPTAVFGPLGVVAAVATLRRLDRVATRHALGLAVAHSGGVMGNFGSMAKPLQGGRAAQAGIVSIRMALAGITAGADALDGRLGLLAALSPNGNADLDTPADYLGKEWYGAAHGLNVKRYPTVGASQRVIDAALQLREKFAVRADDIAQVTVHISEKHAAVMPFHRARNDMEAKFCVEYAAAAALIAGQVGLQQLKMDFVKRADVQALMEKVSLAIGPDNDPVYPVGAACDWIDLVTHSRGSLSSDKVERALGHAHNPMSTRQLKEKFMDCATWTRQIADIDADKLYAQLQNLEQIERVTDLSLTA